MRTEHTPWELVTEDDPRGQPVPYYRGLICIVSATPRLSVVTANGSTVDSEHWPRIGRLIAAAPELLEALRDVTEFADSLRKERAQGGSMEDVRRIETARAAIAKATA